MGVGGWVFLNGHSSLAPLRPRMHLLHWDRLAGAAMQSGSRA